MERNAKSSRFNRIKQGSGHSFILLDFEVRSKLV